MELRLSSRAGRTVELSRKYKVYDIPNQTISEWKRDAEIIVNKRKTRYTEKEVYKLDQYKVI